VSCDVLVIPEDPTYNGAILKPLVSRILEDCGRPRANVAVLANPKVAGFEHAVAMLPRVIERYAHLNLLLLLVDADGKDRAASFQNLEVEAAERNSRLICCAAKEEVEAWLLAGHLSKLDRPWADVRMDVSVKENVFQPFLEKYGDRRRPGGGRDLLIKEALMNYQGLLQRCPELQQLRDRIYQTLY